MKRTSGRGPKTSRSLIPHSKPYIDNDDLRAIASVLQSGQLSQGARVRELERSVARRLNQEGGVATSSGTTALHLALLSLGVGAGDCVAMPSYSCSALLHATEYVGASPLFVDVPYRGTNLSPKDLETKMKRSRLKLSAVIAPHMFGRICDVASIRDVVGDSVPIVEDCAQAIGNPRLGQGDVLICSFYATKMMTTGEGGMVLSKTESILESARDLRDYDEKRSHRTRFNYKMTEMQAALGLSQLRKLGWFLSRRRELSRRYGRKEPSCFRFLISTPEVSSAISMFEARGVRARPPVFMPLHRYVGLPDSAFPGTARAMRRNVSVPLYPALTEEQTQRVLAALEEIMQ